MRVVLFLFIFCCVIALNGCSRQKKDHAAAESQSLSTKYESIKRPSIKIIIDPLNSVELRGDLTRVKFRIADRPGHPILFGTLQCIMENIDNDPEDEVICISREPLANLKNGIYRIILTQIQNDGGLYCSIFEYDPSIKPLQLIVTSKTSGECILAQLKTDSGLTESIIRQQVQIIFNTQQESSFDLERSLYELMWYYNQESNSIVTNWSNFVSRIKNAQPKANSNKVIGGVLRKF